MGPQASAFATIKRPAFTASAGPGVDVATPTS